MQEVKEIEIEKSDYMAQIQKMVDEIRKRPEFKNYVNEHKLRLLDDRMVVIDEMLDRGMIK